MGRAKRVCEYLFEFNDARIVLKVLGPVRVWTDAGTAHDKAVRDNQAKQLYKLILSTEPADLLRVLEHVPFVSAVQVPSQCMEENLKLPVCIHELVYNDWP